jgi:hypothetical protein
MNTPSLKDFQALFAEITFQPFSHEISSFEGLKNQPKTPLVEAFFQLEEDRLKQYQWMVFANHQEALEAIYPYTYQLVSDQWDGLVSAYLQAHPPQSYQLFDVVKAFPSFLSEQEALTQAFPFLEDLATYEQLEAQLLKDTTSISKAEAQSLKNPCLTDDLETTSPVLNPASSSFSSFYTVDLIVEQLKQCKEAETDLPTQWASATEPLILWVYRDLDFSCRFFKVSGVVQQFLSLALQSHGEKKSYRVLLEEACSAYDMALTPAIEAGFQSFLCVQLHPLGIVVGSVAV